MQTPAQAEQAKKSIPMHVVARQEDEWRQMRESAPQPVADPAK